jgi:hypothetical protein
MSVRPRVGALRRAGTLVSLYHEACSIRATPVMTRNGQLRYELKTPWRNGTTHVIFEPLDFVARLVALVPKPRVNLTRFHGVFA